MKKVCVVGLGKAGLPLAGRMAECGLNVVGVDIDPKRTKMINSGKNPIPQEPELFRIIKKYGGKTLIATTNYSDAKDCKVFIIIVPLFIGANNTPDFSIIESAVRSVGRLLKKNDLVVVETTVPVGTTETKVRKWLEQESGLKLGDFYLANSPERIATGVAVSRYRDFPKVIGGVDKKSGEIGFKFYKKFVNKIQLVSSARTAEFIKIIEGVYRDVNIGLANELFKVANELKVDYYESREYANHAYCHLLLPSTGVGGHCIPVYPWFLITEMEKREKYDFSQIMRTSRKVNDEMINYWFQLLVEKMLSIKKPIKQIKVCVKGITFRANVKAIYHSRNLAFARLLKKKELSVSVYDKLFSKKEIEKLGFKYLEPKRADIIFDSFKNKFQIRRR